tara:strand:+ start:696 stop:1082 length:387 start_codon:yes stop_codon:yes gene_type:complete
MNDFPYLIAIALIQDGDKRAMPLGGKSIKGTLRKESSPGIEGESIALELLTRIFQRSEKQSIRSALCENNLFLIEIPIDNIQTALPNLKNKWIAKGNYQVFLEELKNITSRIWSLKFIKYKGVIFDRI